MSKKIENEASTTAAIKGFSAPLGYDPEKPSKKHNPKEIDEDEELENLIIRRTFGDPPEAMPPEETDEVVRKEGERWIIFDDDTNTEVGSYPSRDIAWEKQRIYRKRRNYLKGIEKGQKEKDVGAKIGIKPSDKTIAAKRAGEKSIKKFSTKGEALLKAIVGKVLSEGFIARINEEAPQDEEAQNWDNFFDKLSDTVKLSDPQIKPLIEKIEGAKGKALKKASLMLKDTLEKTGSFLVSNIKVGKDPATKEWKLDFTITTKKGKKALPMSVKLYNSKPVIFYPDPTIMELSKAGDNEAKVLKAELIHIQETELDNITDVLVATSKRNAHLDKLTKEVESKLKEMSGVEMAILKYLSKTKYGSVK